VASKARVSFFVGRVCMMPTLLRRPTDNGGRPEECGASTEQKKTDYES
jgi:hypothetical protein